MNDEIELLKLKIQVWEDLWGKLRLTDKEGRQFTAKEEVEQKYQERLKYNERRERLRKAKEANDEHSANAENQAPRNSDGSETV